MHILNCEDYFAHNTTMALPVEHLPRQQRQLKVQFSSKHNSESVIRLSVADKANVECKRGFPSIINVTLLKRL